ncbi:hypothetical protein ABENE_23035 [Asticcacaulis benevestitus DSM 16100 = ATCC BAA-896]|uniref:Uncharacterized protein n=2 Tax=Asticcacaulis TaxID=76890 RepID=V4QHK5_9CAUL|nr:hypothetical protein [Asticcacaulis benevestitus]ESQ78653.1 hypothetical protein ABENE_23035 [Asticcacaulis benevestitus DSM 16100 = ATCC BAA-896]
MQEAPRRNLISAETHWDLAAARLWIAFRTPEMLDRLYPIWDFDNLPTVETAVFEQQPDVALISALRRGVNISAFGVVDGEFAPSAIGREQWRFMSIRPDVFAGNVGCAGCWRGIVFDAVQIRKAFPSPHPGRASYGLVGAELDLRVHVRDFMDGRLDCPVGRVWQEEAIEKFGLSGRGAKGVWGKVASDFPFLSDAAGKKKSWRHG